MWECRASDSDSAPGWRFWICPVMRARRSDPLSTIRRRRASLPLDAIIVFPEREREMRRLVKSGHICGFVGLLSFQILNCLWFYYATLVPHPILH